MRPASSTTIEAVTFAVLERTPVTVALLPDYLALPWRSEPARHRVRVLRLRSEAAVRTEYLGTHEDNWDHRMKVAHVERLAAGR